MDDSKLLELAGLAAGETYSQERNPLERDDLALRLAVKLGLDVCIDTPMEIDPHTHAIGFLDDTPGTVDVIEHHGDPYAATRRAIVRAAAEIGRNMK